MLSLQYTSLATHYRYVGILVCVVMILVEAGRLYLAYEGNLKEKVSTYMLPFSNYLTLLQNANSLLLVGYMDSGT